MPEPSSDLREVRESCREIMYDSMDSLYLEGEARGEARGRAEGAAQGRKEIVINMLSTGLSEDDTARYAKIPLAEVKLMKEEYERGAMRR